MATASYLQAEVSTEGVIERDNLNRGREKCVIIPSNILLASDGTSLRKELRRENVSKKHIF